MTCIILDPFPPDDDDDSTLCGLGDLNKDILAIARQMGALTDILQRLASTGYADDNDRKQLTLLRRANIIICDRYARNAPVSVSRPAAAVAAPGSFAADRRRRRLRRGDRPKILRLTRPKIT